MALRPVDARVLACLIEKETTVPDSYPLTAKALRSACNQTSNRNPVTSLDDRTIDDALTALKSIGLVRFVHPSHGGRTLRYRHVADERWDLGRGELGVLAMLILRGPETEATLRARAERFLDEGGVSVTEALDELMARRPDQFVERLDRRPGEREPRYAQLLTEALEGTVESEPPSSTPADTDITTPTTLVTAAVAPPEPHAPTPTASSTSAVESLVAEVAELRRRIDRLERLIDG